ncbi:hypothetical protein ACHAQH_006738 [Verticillium albo-atrum]
MLSLRVLAIMQAAHPLFAHGQDDSALIQMTWPDSNDIIYQDLDRENTTVAEQIIDGVTTGFPCPTTGPPPNAKRALLSIDGPRIQFSQMWDDDTRPPEIGMWMISQSVGQFEGLVGADEDAFAYAGRRTYSGIFDLGTVCNDVTVPKTYGNPRTEGEGSSSVSVEEEEWDGVNATLGLVFIRTLPDDETVLQVETVYTQCAYVQFTSGPVPASPCQAVTSTVTTASSTSTRTGFPWSGQSSGSSSSPSDDEDEDDSGGRGGPTNRNIGLAVGLSLGFLLIVGLVAYCWPRLPVQYTSRLSGSSASAARRSTPCEEAPPSGGHSTLRVPAAARTASARSSTSVVEVPPGGWYYSRPSATQEPNVEAGPPQPQEQQQQQTPLRETEIIMVQRALAESNEPRVAGDEQLPPYPGPPPKYES